MGVAFACLLALPAAAEPLLRVGVLKFGTVNWELDVLRHHGLDRKHGFELDRLGWGELEFPEYFEARPAPKVRSGLFLNLQ